MALRVVALAGGVGGAKLVDGLARVLPPEYLTVIVNTGDDFEHVGLDICPDLDTIVYTLAGVANPKTGWGRAGETWNFLGTLDELGGPTWFRLGDRDLALHVERTRRLRSGWTLSEFTQQVCERFNIDVRVIPMSDDPVRTIVVTHEGELPFQEYFVAQRCEPVVCGFRFQGVELAKPAPGVVEALSTADAVVFCPSNPWVSLDPILAVPGIQPAIQSKIVVGVSPIIGGKAIKGPTDKIYRELGIAPSALAVAEHYRQILTGFVCDQEDHLLAEEIGQLGMKTLVSNTVMRGLDDRHRLALEIMAFLSTLLDTVEVR
jgi:LPPG:FO 2-phospho-L-lactate transferase